MPKLADKLKVNVASLPPSCPSELPATQSWGSEQNLEMTGDLLFIDEHRLENITGC